MKGKLLYTSIFFTLLISGLLLWRFWPTYEVTLKQAAFTEMPGWRTSDAKKSLQAFQLSCKTFLRQNPEKSVGSQYIDLKAKDWHPTCKAAQSLVQPSEQQARDFFEQWFTPVVYYKRKPIRGLFTGYYLPLLQGSLTKTEEFNIPLYSLPKNLVTVSLGQFDSSLKHHRHIVGRLKGNKLIPYYTRKQINEGAIAKEASVLAWINSEVDRQFLEIEGSGVVQLRDGSLLFIGYEGENGAAYRSIASLLIDRGIMTRDNASMQRIRKYFKDHPEKVRSILNHNKSFVFFNILPHEAALGAQGLALTPGYSLAVDRQWVPLGTPIWLNTTRPGSHKSAPEKVFQRLMVAQDTGGAIRGPVRGDVFWGAGERATHIAGHMKNAGYYWLLLPNHVVAQLKIPHTS